MGRTHRQTKFENPIDVFIHQKRERELELRDKTQIDEIKMAIERREHAGHPLNHNWQVNGIRTVRCIKCGETRAKFAELNTLDCINLD